MVAGSPPPAEPRAGVPLAPCTTLGVGGPARWFADATRAEDVAAYAAWAAVRGLDLFVLGGGSNLVIADTGIDALVLRMAMAGTQWRASGDDRLVKAAAGEPWDDVVAGAVARGWHGIECLSGIPGSVGGTPIQNVGAYGQEVSDTIRAVTAFDRTTGALTTFGAADCGFAYRTSRFKTVDRGRFVICDVTYALRGELAAPAYPDVREALARAGVVSATAADVRRAVLEVRRRKGMVVDASDPDTRSVGSFFMNPVVDRALHQRVAAAAGTAVPAFALPDGRVKIPAAWLIERAGFARGHRDGRAAISTRHTLALVNAGGATARDILRLAVHIKRTVRERWGVSLCAEPVCVGFGPDADVSYLQGAED